MAKRSKEKEETRLWNSGHALLSERQRTIDENSELKIELFELRKRYEINFKNLQDQVRWMDSQSKDILINFFAGRRKPENKARDKQEKQ